MRWLMRLLIRTYQLIVSPIIGPRCRYLPTCSEYFLEALENHGVLTGTRMGMKRIVRCHPWGSHGYDPVPVPESDYSRESSASEQRQD